MNDALITPVNEVQAGAILAAAVEDSSGAMLLPAGLTLSEAHLQGLLRRKIGAISIIPAECPAEEAQRREAVRQRVMYLFRRSADDPGSQALLHAVLAFREKR